jgi:hypothetical protein
MIICDPHLRSNVSVAIYVWIIFFFFNPPAFRASGLRPSCLHQ